LLINCVNACEIVSGQANSFLPSRIALPI